MSALTVGPEAKAWPILVGGQAVNFWAQLYAGNLPELSAWQPFLSKDCDVYGNRETAQRMQETSGWKLSLFPPREMAVAGLVSSDGRTVEVLSVVHGLTPKDFDRMCVRIQTSGRFLSVLNPIALLKAKMANVAELDQSLRQDRRHVAMLIPVAREFLRQAIGQAKTEPANERDVVTLLEVALLVAVSPQANSWKESLGANFGKLLPWEEGKSTSLAKVRNFFEKRLPRVLQQI